jgi:hypothetical protein
MQMKTDDRHRKVQVTGAGREREWEARACPTPLYCIAAYGCAALRLMGVLPLHGWASATEPVELVQRGQSV